MKTTTTTTTTTTIAVDASLRDIPDLLLGDENAAAFQLVARFCRRKNCRKKCCIPERMARQTLPRPMEPRSINQYFFHATKLKMVILTALDVSNTTS